MPKSSLHYMDMQSMWSSQVQQSEERKRSRKWNGKKIINEIFQKMNKKKFPYGSEHNSYPVPPRS